MVKVGVATILGIVSLMISVIALCVAAYRTPDLEFDYQGVLTGVLSLLVTVLIGWQIYTSISLEEKMEACVDRSVQAMERDHKVKMYKMQQDAIGSSIAAQGMSLFYSKNYTESFQCCMNALAYLHNGDQACEESKNSVDLCFEFAQKTMNLLKEKKQVLNMSSGDKTIYLKTLARATDVRANELIPFVVQSRC